MAQRQDLTGEKIQHFRIGERLGRGGMGHVYLAHDEKLNRKVALKILRHDHRVHPEAKARLRREARLLSQLDHPNICRIFDLVEDEDHEFLVLEYIEGIDLRKARRKHLLDDRYMDVAEQIAAALTAAHAHGVVHRDLKPENVLLTPEGDVKVLDFGIALAVGDQESEKHVPQPTGALSEDSDATEAGTIFSGTESGVVTGTLAYMSPEQARGETITAAGDMYSLGLLLQELFTGERAYPKSSAATLLRRASQANTLPIQGVDPDLAVLIERLKSLEPAARPAAQDAADRLAWIRRKPQMKRRRILLAAALVGLTIIAAVMTGQAYLISREVERANAATRQAAAEAERANREALAAERVAGFLENLFAVSNPSEGLGNEITAREILDRGAEEIRRDSDLEPQIQARLMTTMGKAYQGLGLFQDAEPLYRDAVEIAEENLTEELVLADSLAAWAGQARLLGRLSQSEELYSRALEIFREQNASKKLADALSQLGILFWYQGRNTEALPPLDESEEIIQSLEDYDPRVRAYNLHITAFVQYELGDYAAAERLFDRSLALRVQHLPKDHPEISWTLHGLAVVHTSLQEFEEADDLLKRSLKIRETVLGPDHHLIGWLENSFGEIDLLEERYDEADAHYQKALTLVQDPPNRSIALMGRARVEIGRGRLAEAEDLLQQSYDLWVGNLGEGHSQVAKLHGAFGDLRRAQGRDEEARESYGRAIEFFGEASDHPLTEDYRARAARIGG